MRQAIRLALSLALVGMIVLWALPEESSAIPYTIQGYLKDSKGVPIGGARISITGPVYNNSVGDYTDETAYATTDANGHYVIHVGVGEPGGFDMNRKVKVSYSSNDKEASQVITLQGLGAWANLTYEGDTGILNFLFSTAGVVMVIVIVSATLFAFYIYRSPDNQSKDQAPKRVERRRRQR